MKILVLDNYDSFTYNLVQYIQEIIGKPVTVKRNDEISLDEVDTYDIIFLSPGPGIPSEAGIMPELIRTYAGKKYIFGVCLGHQAIGEAFGSELENMSQVYHGIETPIKQVGADNPIFLGIPEIFSAGRYHSWVIQQDKLAPELICTAIDTRGEIMGLRHRKWPIFGVQFHPESIMTPDGKKMLENFLIFCGLEIPAAI
jgi:anthranilate synthase component 2